MDELSHVWQALDGLDEAKRDEKIATFAAAAHHPTARDAAALVGLRLQRP